MSMSKTYTMHIEGTGWKVQQQFPDLLQALDEARAWLLQAGGRDVHQIVVHEGEERVRV